MSSFVPSSALPLLFALLSLASPAMAATFTVTRGDDPAPGSCLINDCSLREAVAATVATAEADLIRLGEGQYQITRGELALSGTVTVAGTGTATTSLTGTATFTIVASPFAALTLQGLRLGRPDESALVLVQGNASATLRDVHVPLGTVGVDGASAANSHLRVEDSTIRGLVCFQNLGSCRAVRSHLQHFLAANAEVELRHVELDGEDLQHWGVIISGNQPALIEDSTIRRMNRPLLLGGFGASGPAPAAVIRRTRFLDNNAAITGDRDSSVTLEDVEFRRHIVADDALDQPSVLLAMPGPRWRIYRALIANNRGGSGDGSTVRVDGGFVNFSNSSFEDNTYRGEAGGATGHTLGVIGDGTATTVMWLINSTVRRALTSTSDFTTGTVLSVNGTNTQVALYGSLLVGTCRFLNGGALSEAQNNIESARDTCTLGATNNFVSITAAQLALASLANHGGFSDVLMPGASSFALNRGNAGWCTLLPLDQRRYSRPPNGTPCDAGAVERDGIRDTIFQQGFD